MSSCFLLESILSVTMQAEDKKDKKKKASLNSRGVTDEYCLRVSTNTSTLPVNFKSSS